MVIIFAASCKQQKSKKEKKEKYQPLSEKHAEISGTYRYNEPDSVWEMPYELREISGICFNREGKILCNEDQNGEIYVYSLQKKTVEKITVFYGKGDFEDIAYDNDTVYVLRSDGDIFKVYDYLSSNPITRSFNTILKEDNNCEGLFFDNVKNRLLVACKGNSGIHNANQTTKAIYEFDLTTKIMAPEPAFVITKKELMTVYGDEIDIEPSAIAINPINKNIFILGTKADKVLIELLPNGKLLHVSKLNNPLFIQPEGICFGSNGDLYISNEGKDGNGNILLFKYLN